MRSAGCSAACQHNSTSICALGVSTQMPFADGSTDQSRRTKTLVHAQLAAVLRAPEVMLQPSAGDARLTLGRLLRGVVESAKALPRWMDGTCTCCEGPAAG